MFNSFVMVLAGGKEISGLGVVTHFITILNNELIINKNSYIRLQIDNDCTYTIHLPYKNDYLEEHVVNGLKS